VVSWSHYILTSFIFYNIKDIDKDLYWCYCFKILSFARYLLGTMYKYVRLLKMVSIPYISMLQWPYNTTSSYLWRRLYFIQPFTTQIGQMPSCILSNHEYTALLKLAAFDSSFSLSISPKLNGKCVPGSVSLL
jgi:hypothetical protein